MPLYDSDLDLKRRLKVGSTVRCRVTNPRNYRFHKKFFALVRLTFDNLPDVFAHHGITSPFCKEIEPMHGYKVGGFGILPLPVVHDVPCVGFIIEHEEMGKLIFITDTMMLEYKLPKLNHIMLEANYADEILQHNIEGGIVPVSMRDRLLHSHMELQTAKEILRANDLSAVNEVILLHLSSNNSDAEQFQREVQETAGKPVCIAKPGMEINLDKDPY